MIAELKLFMHVQGVTLTNDDLALISAAAIIKKVKRRELLLKAGEVCRYKIFINHGFLRTYRVDAEGNEHIIQFSPECTWTTEGESYANIKPSVYHIDALEDSELLIWTKESFDQLLNAVPALKLFSEQLIFNNLHASRHRLYKAISSTPEEKYRDFTDTHPRILQRVPLRMVASYLGVSLKTLTRIRQAQLQQ